MGSRIQSTNFGDPRFDIHGNKSKGRIAIVVELNGEAAKTIMGEVAPEELKGHPSTLSTGG